LRVLHGRLKAVFVASLAAIILVGVLGPATTLAADPPGLGRFMYAIGRVESGGNYTARNARTGAYGKYQIIPSSWRAWAGLYLGDPNAPKTPANQEFVAASKFRAAYRFLGGSWRRVAYQWLTGSSRTTGWSSFATSYVNKVMAYYQAATDRPVPGGDIAGAASTIQRRYQESNPAIVYTGSWRVKSGSANAGGAVRVATTRNASASLSFYGKTITWNALVGPTLGWARVFIDGALVKRVTLNRSSTGARRAVFNRTWASVGQHTIRIEVIGTRGHPGVSLDEFVLTR